MAGLESAFTILLLIALGALAAWLLRIDDAGSATLASLVVSVAFPAYIIDNLLSNYDRAALLNLAPGLAVPVLSICTCFFLGLAVARIFRLSASRRGLFSSMFSLSNTVFMGLPVNVMLFGNSCVPFVLLYYIANTTILWTLGTYCISRDGCAHSGSFFSIANLKHVLSPPFVSVLVAVCLVLSGATLPKFVLNTCRTIGSITSPLSMIFVGVVLYGADWTVLRPSKDLFLLLCGRFVVAPLMVMMLCALVPLPALMKRVFVIQASMPVSTQASILSRAYEGDYRYAAVMTSATTLVSLFAIPFYMLVFTRLNVFG